MDHIAYPLIAVSARPRLQNRPMLDKNSSHSADCHRADTAFTLVGLLRQQERSHDGTGMTLDELSKHLGLAIHA
jgi:hypothetical protein